MFVVQTLTLLLSYLRVERFVTGNLTIMILLAIICIVAIYVVCWIVYLLYHFVKNLIFKALSTRINLPMIDAKLKKGLFCE
jgi:hypothetical protein